MELQTSGKENKAERLLRLGFKYVATELTELLKKKRKLALAYEHYRFVTPEKVAQFNAELFKKTVKNASDPLNMSYQKLDFVSIGEYQHVPPEEVLFALENAQARKCFDSYEIAFIRNVKDPLLFGRVEGTPNKFFIAQWDTDISITDLLKENEG